MKPVYMRAIHVLPSFFLLLLLLEPAYGITGDAARVRLIERLSSSVVGVNSVVLKSVDLMSVPGNKGTGSGFVMDSAGHVATLRHIISDRHSIEVILWDGTTWSAVLKGEDRETGIAVLAVQAPDKVLRSLQGVRFASAPVLPGQDLLALGRTEGGEMLMAASGMVSCGPRTVVTPDNFFIYDMIQTDRPFAPGFDGGPLFDTTGHVLGMTAGSVVRKSDDMLLVDFAIPASTVSWIVSSIIENGCVNRAWIGANLITVTPALARFLGLHVQYGALVTSVVPGGPAAKAGLAASAKTLCLGNRVYPVGGDIIVAMGRSDIKSDADVIKKLREYKPGDKALISIYRGNRLMRIKIVLGSKK